MEDILIVSNYYPPEKGAAANRIEQLALNLQKHQYRVRVVCPLANYPQGRIFDGYRGRFIKNEELSGVGVKRLWIYPSISKNPFRRILSIFSFSSCLFFYLMLGRIPQKVIVQSPPLLLSFLAVFALILRRRKIILNVSDLWPSAAIELGALERDSFSHRMLLRMERFIYRRATLILGQSEEILSHVERIAPHKPCHLYRNLPDHQQAFERKPSGTTKIFYAGLLGVAQGVLECCRQIEPGNFEFHIFGDGAEKEQIEDFIQKHPEKNIRFHGMVARAELHRRLADFHVAFVPLKTRIYGSVPSKIFEYGMMGIPILYFGGGEGEDIVREYKLGWTVPVEDYEALNEAIREISGMSPDAIAEASRRVLNRSRQHFNLDRQMGELVSMGVF